MGEHEIAGKSSSWHPKALRPRVVWVGFAITCLAAGAVILALVISGARRFLELVEDEGTESYTASYGLMGLVAGLSFLALISGVGAILIAYGVYVLRRIFGQNTARG